MTGNKRFADCHELIDPAQVGIPTYFISHAWKGSFYKLLTEVIQFLRHASLDTKVWIDIFAVNQHSDTSPEQNKADVDAFAFVLQLCQAGTIGVVDALKCSPATRAWCLYE